ncbi:MAG: GspH/FimT family pseudopilin [Rubrivivax sp.]|nr:GspH/FimT family pseudopilin [Rubrivivax sp.]
MKRHPAPRRQRGTTLVEAATVTAIVSIVTAMALPGFGPSVERRHIEGAAAQLETDLQLARATAVASNAGVRVSFHALADGGSCYVMHTGAAGDCGCAADGQPVCRPGAEALRTAHYGPGVPVRIASNSRSILFDPVKGTVTPSATMKVQGRSGAAVHQVVNIMGRVRSCSPAPAMAGYKTC